MWRGTIRVQKNYFGGQNAFFLPFLPYFAVLFLHLLNAGMSAGTFWKAAQCQLNLPSSISFLEYVWPFLFVISWAPHQVILLGCWLCGAGPSSRTAGAAGFWDRCQPSDNCHQQERARKTWLSPSFTDRLTPFCHCRITVREKHISRKREKGGGEWRQD